MRDGRRDTAGNQGQPRRAGTGWLIEHPNQSRALLVQDPKEFLGPIKEQLQQRIKQFADAVASGTICVDNEGMHLERQPSSPEDLRVADLRRALYADRGEGQIAEMMLQIDSTVRFSWLLLGREPYHRSELLLTYAGVLALSTAMSAAQVARMVPGLSP